MEIRDTRNGEWFWVYTALLADPHLFANDKLVYSAISTFGGHQVIHPTIDQIAERCGASERGVRLSLKKLEEVGYLSIEGSTGRGNANVYYLLKKPKGCNQCPFSKGGNEQHERVQPSALKGAMAAPHIDKIYKKDTCGEEPPRIVLSKESEEEERPKKETRSKDKLAVYGLFSSKEQPWWRHAQQKKAALSLFDLVGVERVKRGLVLMKENEDDKYCPQAATPFEYEEKLEALKRYAKNHA